VTIFRTEQSYGTIIFKENKNESWKVNAARHISGRKSKMTATPVNKSQQKHERSQENSITMVCWQFACIWTYVVRVSALFEQLIVRCVFCDNSCQAHLKYWNNYSRTSRCDHLTSATSFPKYQKILSQITIFGTSCKRSPLVSDRDHF